MLTWALAIVAAVYGIGIVAAAAVWSFAPTLHWSVAFTNIFAAFFFLPLIPLVLVAVWTRSRLMLVVSVIVAAVFVGMFGPRFVPRRIRPDAGSRRMRMATFNELYLNGNLDGLIGAIRGEEADVVALQELTPPVAAAMEQRLKATYPYQMLRPSPDVGGVGLLSRFPLEPVSRAPAQGEWATFQVGGRTIMLVNVHIHFSGISRIRSQRFFSLPYFRVYDMAGRLNQVRALRRAVDHVGGDAIVAGDFNTGDREPGYQVLASDFHDAFGERGFGFGFTYPNHKRIGPVTPPVPLVRIDYIWTRGSVVPLAAHTNCDDGGSDHCMVVADLELQGGHH